MAKQNKGRKLFATTATAALVASALVPAAAFAADQKVEFKDASKIADWAKKSVDYLVGKGAIKGDDKGNFNPEGNLTRAEAATILVGALGLTVDNNAKTTFADAKDHWSSKYIAALQAHNSKIISGYEDGTFKPEGKITRQELATIVVNAYNLKAEESAVLNFTDNTGWGKDYVTTLASLGIVAGKSTTSFAPNALVTRQEAAAFVHRTEVPAERVDVETTVAKVTSVTAISPNTLSFTGTGLKGLKAADITVAGNTVTSVVATNGKTATVTLGGVLPEGKDVKVTVKSGEETKEFTVKFSLNPTKVALKEAIFDEDTAGQKFTVLVDGVETSVDYLLSAGYSVVFNTFKEDGTSANTDIFGTATASTTGALKTGSAIALGDYTATVVISKGSTILTSDKVKFSVRNMDNAASAITKFNFFLDKGTPSTADSADVELNSKTLAIGEAAYLGTVTLGVGASATEVSGTGANSVVELKSSNPNIVSVSPTGFLKAEAVGTSVITVTVGKVSQTFTVTVNGEQRKAVTVNASSSKHIINRAISSKGFEVLDQYGDPFDGPTGLEVVAPISVTGLVTSPVGSITASAGWATVALGTPSVAGQSGTVVVRNATTKATVGSFVVTTTEVNSIASTKLAYATTSESSDDNLNADLASDDTVTYVLRNYTSEGVNLGDVANLTGYVVKFNPSVVSVNGNVTGEYNATGSNLTLTIRGAGSTQVAVYDSIGNLVDQKTVTVQNASTKITGVAWKTVPVINYTTTIDYATVLDVTPAVTGFDPIVKGITLSSPVANAIRIATNNATPFTGAGNADIYIDRNDNGRYDIADTRLGKLTYSSTSTSTGSIAGLSNILATTPKSVAVGVAGKGYINFSLTDETTSTKPVISTKSVEVDVK